MSGYNNFQGKIMTKLSSLVLLAGDSRRMGRPKQHVELGRQTFLNLIISKLLLNRQFLDNLVFVGQSGDETGQQQVAAVGGIWVNNPNPENGPLSSIRLALACIPPDSAIMLWPVDHPMVAASTVTELMQTWQQTPDKITVPSDGQKRGHPGIFPAWCQRVFFEIDLNAGARQIMQMHPDKISHVVTDDIWITRNLNTPQLLDEAEKWLKDRL